MQKTAPSITHHRPRRPAAASGYAIILAIIHAINSATRFDISASILKLRPGQARGVRHNALPDETGRALDHSDGLAQRKAAVIRGRVRPWSIIIATVVASGWLNRLRIETNPIQ